MDTSQLPDSPQQGGPSCQENLGEDPGLTLRARWDALPEEAQEKILDKHRGWNVDYEWWDCCKEYFIEKMEGCGIFVKDTRFSGFWSQGDGASFAGHIEDFQKFIESHNLLKYQPLIDFARHDDWREFVFEADFSGWYYSHSNTMGFSHRLDDNYDLVGDPLLQAAIRQRCEDMQAMASEFFDEAKRIFVEAADKYYCDLEAEYEGLTSDDAVLESLMSNEEILEEEIENYENEHAEEGEKEFP